MVAKLTPVRPLKSYSQQGEDLVLAQLLSSRGIEKPYYVDIGANDPVNYSNTYLFYRQGGEGVCVEPNPVYNRRYRYYRPRDVVLNIGVTAGPTTTSAYYKMDWPEFNTFDKQQAEAVAATYGARNALQRVTTLSMVNINELLQKHAQRPIDLLSLDVEGLDLEILTALDFETWGPRVICVEHSELCQTPGESTATTIRRLLESKGYSLEAHNTMNAMYVRKGRAGDHTS